MSTDANSIMLEGDQEFDGSNKLLPSPDLIVTRPQYYTIPEGTILYHGTKTINQFESTYINLGQTENDNFAVWFTPDKEVSERQIAKCQAIFGNDGNLAVNEGGWIHAFRVKSGGIPYIKLVSADDKDLKFAPKEVSSKFCKVDPNNKAQRINGIGFFRKVSESEFESQFALCTTTEYLEYVGTYSCIGTVLSKQMNDKSGLTIIEPNAEYSQEQIADNYANVNDQTL